MTSAVETPAAPTPEAQNEPEQQEKSTTITERRAALEKKFGGFASKGNMSDEDVDKWFDSLGGNEKILEALYADEKPAEEADQEQSQSEKRNVLRRLVPRKVESVPTMEEMQAYQDAAAENIAEAKRAYEAKRENLGKVNLVGKINNAYIMGVLKRAEKRAAKDAKYAQKRERREDESAEAYAKRLKWYDRRSRAVVALGVVTGGALYLGSRGMHDYNWIHDQITGDSHDVALAAAQQDTSAQQEAPGSGQFKAAEALADQNYIDGFKYDPGQDPFYLPGKQGVHDFGAPLQSNPLDGTKPAGWNDWTQTRLTNSPEQLASIATGLGVDGQTDANMNQLAEQFKGDPKLMSHYHEEVLKILSDQNTKVREEAITGPYASLYEWDQNGDGVLARDDYVNEGGTKMIIEFGPADNRQVMEIRKECGGQRCWAPVIPVQQVSYSAPQGNGSYSPVSYAVPQGNGSYTPPQGNGNYTPPSQQPPSEQPPSQQPPTEQPPTEQPPTEQPPVEQPPVVAKDPTEDINVNPGLPEILQMGADRVGPGLLQGLDQVTAPPANYDNPIGNMGTRPASPGSVAPGADASPGSLGQHSQAPAAQAGSTGNSSNGNSETTRVSE